MFARINKKNVLSSFLISLVLTGLALPGLADSRAFVRVETDTLDKEKFVFPEGMDAAELNIVMLAMGTEQDNGEWQGEKLVEWYAALDSAGLLNDEVKAWHFSVMKVPFFVKGLIRGGMADSYKGKLPLNQAAAIFVKNVEKFAAAPGIEVDGEPTIVLVAADGQLLEIFKGELSDERFAVVTQAVSSYTAEPVVAIELVEPVAANKSAEPAAPIEPAVDFETIAAAESIEVSANYDQRCWKHQPVSLAMLVSE